MATSCLRRNSSSIRSGNRSVNDHIGKRSRYGYYKFFVSEEAKNGLLEYAPIAKRKCDTPENHLSWLGSFNRGWLNYYKYADRKELKKICLSVDENQRRFFLSHWNKRAGYTEPQLKTIRSVMYEFVSMHDWLEELMGRLSLIRK